MIPTGIKVGSKLFSPVRAYYTQEIYEDLDFPYLAERIRNLHAVWSLQFIMMFRVYNLLGCLESTIYYVWTLQFIMVFRVWSLQFIMMFGLYNSL